MCDFIKHKLLILIVSFLFPHSLTVHYCNADLSVDEIKNIDTHISQNFKKLIDEAWKYNKPFFFDYLKTNLEKGNTYALYNMQIYTNNLVRYCSFVNDYEILNDLIEINLLSYKYLIFDRDGFRKWIYTFTDDPELVSLINKEIELSSIQYLYLISKIIHIIASIDQNKRTSIMSDFVDKFLPIIIKDHYLRWLPNYTTSLERKYLKLFPQKFQNAINDKELQLAGGIAEILSANSKDNNLIPLTTNQKESMISFINLANRLLRSRLSESELVDFNGEKVKGINFDLGMWDEYPDYSYSGYTGTSFPTLADKKSATNVGWDISHARRLVHVFDSLYEYRNLTNGDFPDESVMVGLTNQVVYGVFNKDFDKPLFTNYMDGTNGWYRVNYANRENFGYGPYALSNSIPTGGYGFWSRYNPDMNKILNSFWSMIKKGKTGKPDNEYLSVIGNYYSSGYFKIDQSPSNILMFLPSMVSFYDFEVDQQLNFYPGWNLFSINLIMNDNSIDYVLGSIKEDFLFLYTYDNKNKLWLCYFPEYPYFSDIFTIDFGKGYWIYMEKKKTLTIRGKLPKDKSVKLITGWNLVGYNSSEPETVQSALFSISSQCSYIWTYDTEKGWMVYIYNDKYTSEKKLEILTPGRGYWIFVKEDCIWDIDLFL